MPVYFKGPDKHKIAVPVLCSWPIPANHSPPRETISGT